MDIKRIIYNVVTRNDLEEEVRKFCSFPKVIIEDYWGLEFRIAVSSSPMDEEEWEDFLEGCYINDTTVHLGVNELSVVMDWMCGKGLIPSDDTWLSRR